MSHEVETMFSARKVPWHGLGTVTEDALTADDAIREAGLDWEVKLHSLYAQIGKNKKKIADRFAVVRQSDEAVFGTVGQRYVPFQNFEAFAFADHLVHGGAKFETAGALKGGRVVFMTMKVPLEVAVAGDDAHDLYIVLRTSHDGTKAVGVYVTPIRVVCQNTMTMAVDSARQSWQMIHTRSMEGRVQEARETLRLTEAYAESFVEMGDLLVSTRVTDDQLIDLLEEALPARPKTSENIDEIIGLYRESDTNGFRGNLWGGYNAVTEWLDHVRPAKTTEGSFISTMDGQVSNLRQSVATRFLDFARA